jgi:organic radical activating enzyme
MRCLRELIFSVTNRCTARCRDCPIVHEGSPPLSLTADEMIRIMDDILPYGFLRLVVFTGGEPFLIGDDLKRAVEYAARHGVLTRIVTNAFWATTKEKALEILQGLKQAGLTELNISCDDFHQEFVPLKNIRNANEAAIAIGLPLLFAYRRNPGGLIDRDYLSKFLGVELKTFIHGEDNPKNNIILDGINVPIKSGRAQNFSNSSDDSWMGPCESVLSRVIIASDKRVQICCGIASSSIEELYIGTLYKDGSLLEILQKGNEDLLTNWLALEGPSSILSFVRSKDRTIELPDSYVNRCHACNDLLSRDDVREILAQHGEEKCSMIEVMRGILDWIMDERAHS